MKKKTLLTAGFISVLFLIAIAEACFVKFAQANPYLYYESVSPPSDVKPPTISANPLKNNTVYASNKISLTLNVSIPEPANYALYLTEIRYQMDWKDNFVTVYHYPVGSGLWITDFSDDLTLTEIPEGSHNITFVADAHGGYGDGLTGKYFNLASYSTIYFSVDTTSPSVSILSLENRIYETSDIPLNFTVNESVSRVSYSLDGLDNVTIAGNTTLAGLSVGEHNVTVYAWDEAENVGSSETITFTIAEPEPEPFSTTMVIAPIASVAVVGVGLLLYLKKRKMWCS